jgi:uridine phosphorylase
MAPSNDGKGGAYYSDTNGVPKAAGRVTHLGLANGELAQRIVSVGSLSRAKTLRDALDDPDKAFTLTS